MTEVAILIGLPGAGKTSFFQARLAPTHVHVSKDLIGHGRDTSRRQLDEVRKALRAGSSAAVDNTNPTVADRAPILALGREMSARVVAYLLDTTPRESAARNRSRVGKGRVPDVAVFATSKRLQPPTAAEGFDAVYRVHAEGGEFVVLPGE